MVTAAARDGEFRSAPDGGKRRDAMAVGRDHALARLAGQPSLALRALRAELAACGVKVSYGALWRFVHAEGLSFKKKRSGQRDRKTADRPQTGKMATASAAD